MRVAVHTRGGDCFTADHYSRLRKLAIASGIELSFSEEVAGELPFEVANIYSQLPEDIDMVISYGGDGTFLDSVRFIGSLGIPVLGVNSGRLGFLSTVSSEDIGVVLKSLSSGDYIIEERAMLSVEGDFGEDIESPYAFNEFTIQKDGMSMVDISLSIDGKFVADYMADGVIFSTSNGSTAYSLSVGGAILAPSCACFIISPIAAHNLNVRPLVVPDNSLCTISVTSRSRGSLATLDNRTYYIDNNARFTLRRAEKSVKVVRLPEESFFDTLRKKMMWAVDARNR